MAFRAQILELKGAKETIRKGDYDFVASPAPGDRLVIGNAGGDLEMFRVVRLKHLPIGVPKSKFEAEAPMIKVYVEWVEPWNE